MLLITLKTRFNEKGTDININNAYLIRCNGPSEDYDMISEYFHPHRLGQWSTSDLHSTIQSTHSTHTFNALPMDASIVLLKTLVNDHK